MLLTGRFIFSSLGILILISMTLSDWWLRPLTWDGGRFTFLTFHTMKPYYEFRPTHGLFQLLPLALGHVSDGISILGLVRFYFILMSIPILSILTFRIYKAQNLPELTIGTTLLIMGYLPGLSFVFSSVFETVFFLLIVFDRFFNGKRNILFYFAGIFAAFGHPVAIAGFVLFLGLWLIDLFSERVSVTKTDVAYIVGVLTIALFSFFKMIIDFPWMRDVPSRELQTLFESRTEPEIRGIYICFLFLLLLFSNILKGKTKILVQSGLMLLMFYLALTIPNQMSTQAFSHLFRIITSVIFLFLMTFKWYISRWKAVKISGLTLYSLFAIGCLFTYREYQITFDYREVFSSIKNMSITKSCEVIFPEEEITAYTQRSLTFFKIFTDDQKDLNYFLFDGNTIPDACKRLVKTPRQHIILPLRNGNMIIMNKNGYFSFSGDL